MSYDVIIIGAGAAGMTAAVFAGRSGARVCVVEHRSEPGKKILQTGNGKCNLTHEGLCAGDYLRRVSHMHPLSVTQDRNRSEKGTVEKYDVSASSEKLGSTSYRSVFLDKAFERFGYDDTLVFFNSIGIPVRNKGGYIYPYSGTALSVRNALWDEMKRLGVRILTDTEPDVKFNDGFFIVSAVTRKKEDGKYSESAIELTGKKLILATGLKAAPGTGSDGSGIELAEKPGLKINTVLPALVKLKCADGICKPASGVRHICMTELFENGKKIFSESGEVQFTDDGISGIPVFNMSRFASPALDKGADVTAALDMLPDFSIEECDIFIENNYDIMKGRKLSSFFGGLLPGKLLTAVARTMSISAEKKAEETGAERLKDLIRRCKSWEMKIEAAHGFEAAQVCLGGVDISQIDPGTMGAKQVPGLYVAGELADIDGPCGGYNLQWAWTSGAIAGMAAGETG